MITLSKTKEAWIIDMLEATDAMEKLKCDTLEEFAKKDKVTCGKLVTAFIAMGQPVEEKIQKMVGMQSIDKLIAEEGICERCNEPYVRYAKENYSGDCSCELPWDYLQDSHD